VAAGAKPARFPLTTLSVHEEPLAANEADTLCELIEQNYATLREAQLGERAMLGGAAFRLLQTDRNTIYRIKCLSKKGSDPLNRGGLTPFRIGSKARLRWYLKIPRRGAAEWIRQEIRGAEAVRESLEGHPGYRHPAAIRASTDTPYLLCAEVPGRTLNRQLYLACWMRRLSAARRVRQAFYYLGDALARLHAVSGEFPGISPLRDAAASLDASIRRTQPGDGTLDAIARWAERNGRGDAPRTFVHGNLKMENVLVRDDRVCLIDFENCGCGTPYDDLSWPVSQVALLETLVFFPWKPGLDALQALLEGYRNSNTYSAELLLRYVTMRVSQYYVDTCCPRFTRPRVAGIPIRRRRLAQMVSALLEERFRDVFPGVPL